MMIDTYGYVIMEQSPLPGGYGDSCAETGRYAVLAYINGTKLDIKFNSFVTDIGVLRHPDSPWREDDTSGDQVSPLIAATALIQPVLGYRVIKQIEDAGYKTGNGDLLSPGIYAQMRRAQRKSFLWLSDLALVGQALLLKLPIRWSDSKRWFESTSGSSCDYLNLVNNLAFARAMESWTWPCWLATKLISQELALSKAKDYYEPEPNNGMILEQYAEAIPKIWK